MAVKIRFVDRLRDRGFVDQWGFFLFAGGGFIGIFAAKFLGVPNGLVTLCAAAAMLGYAAILSRAGTGRLRADQAGDNCYYQGLIYTLASLSYAIMVFDPNSGASTIVSGFGIALITTILGLVLRVYFNQGRPDLENIEEQTRLELTEASSRVKAELNGVVRQMSDFSRQIQQSMEEMHKAAASSMEEFTKTSTAGLQRVVETANETIREEATSFAARSKRFSATFDNLLTKLEQRGEGLEQAAAAQDALVKSADAARRTADGALEAISSLSKAAASSVISARAIDAATGSAASAAERLTGAIERVEGGLESIRTETANQLADLKSGPAQTLQRAMEEMKEAAADMSRQVAASAQLHDRVQAGLSEQTAAAMAMAVANNQALAAELEKSRMLVARVHTALVDMTEGLAATVESTG